MDFFIRFATGRSGIGRMRGAKGNEVKVNGNKIRLAYTGDIREVPLFAALQKGFFKEEGIDKEIYRCFIGINGELVEKDPEKAAAITRAWVRAVKWVAQNPQEAAQLALENKYLSGDPAANSRLIGSYGWKPGVKQVRENIGIYLKEELANQAFAEVIPEL